MKETQQNRQTLEDVMKQYQTTLLRYASCVLNNESAAQDVVQETFIRLNKNLDKVGKNESHLKGWLFRTTHNVSVDYIRKESRRKKLHEKQEMSVTSNSTSDSVEEEQRELVLQHLNILTMKEREAISLRLLEGMSYRQIGRVVKRSEGYVGTLIYTATKKLSKSLRQAGVLA